MLFKSSEQFVRQKVVTPPSYRTENEYNTEAMPQYFQISISIIEGRNLAWLNPHSANSYFIVVFGNKKYRSSLRKNMLEPYYNEMFTFDIYCSIQVLQRNNFWIAIMEPRCYATPRILGETTIDLKSVWSMPNHQITHKWAQLYLPRNISSGPVGFLKLSVSIEFRGEIQVDSAITKSDKLEENILLSGLEQQCANYQITIYEAFNLPCGSYSRDKRYGKPPTTFAKVSFCGLEAKTAVHHKTSNPKYCEQISMVEMFPNMNRLIRIEVCSIEDCLEPCASFQLNLENISHEGENGFLPTFGPSLLHAYGSTNGDSGPSEDGPFYRGCLLIALNTVVPYHHQSIRTVNILPVSPIPQEDVWQMEEFCLYCPVFEVSMLDLRVAGKLCGIAITFGEISRANSGNEEFLTMMNEMRTNKYHYTGSLNVVKAYPYGYLDFSCGFPVLQFATHLPDYRFRMYRHNMIENIVEELDAVIRDVEGRLKCSKQKTHTELFDSVYTCLSDTAGKILNFLEITEESDRTKSNITLFQHCTELDKKQFALQKEEMEKIFHRISHLKISSMQNVGETVCKVSEEGLIVSKKILRLFLYEAQLTSNSLKKILFNALYGWPDIVVWLLNGGSRVAYAKLSPAELVYSVIPDQRGKYCGKIQTLNMKPLKCPYHLNSCSCVVAKVELVLWLSSYLQKSAFDTCIPPGYKLKVQKYDMCLKCSSMMVEYRAFIYQAKIVNSSLVFNRGQLFVRINIFNETKETKVISNTITPLWNQVLKKRKMVFIPPERLWTSPPMASVEVNNIDISGKVEVIGYLPINCNVDDRHDYEFAPKLEWYEIHKGVECTGRILMSVQVVQVLEKLMKSTIYSPMDDSGMKDLDVSDIIEPLPLNLIPTLATFKVDVYWWGLRDVNNTRKPCVTLEIDDMTLKSDVIVDKKANSNFPNGRVSQIFEATFDETRDDYPLLNIRLYNSSSFGRTLYLGANAVKNPMQYMVEWLSKNQREASIQASVMSSDFVQVSPNVCLKKSSQLNHDLNSSISNTDCNISMNNIRSRRSNWHTFCCNTEPENEEEFILLPVTTNKKKQLITKCNSPQQDWWSRYHESQENYVCEENKARILTDKLTIYNSELELQPQFSKFRDWCATLKLYYNGKKSGVEKEKQFYCGRLKVGLAIYRWPPPANTTAVSPSGVDLSKGFFDDHPTNDPAKFLVRAYIVKALDLKVKEFTGKFDPYTIVKCGKKHYGTREHYTSNSANPIFGKMHEFRCSLPEDYIITISLYDYNAVPPDELIGSTSIDLEDRIYSKHRARVGLSKNYSLSGPFKWRDSIKPSRILEELCKKNHMPQPLFIDTATVVVNGVKYVDENSQREKSVMSAEERRENLCLSILHKWYTIPICGYQLVPEHVETRSLYKDDRPGMEQGKLQMWIDIFPLQSDTFVPAHLDIKPRNIEDYELKLTIRDLKLNCVHSIQKNEEMFVRAWVGSNEFAQERKLFRQYMHSEEKFNLRMIFNFQFQHAARKLHKKEIGPFTEFEEQLSPILVIEIMVNKANASTECIGSLNLNLNAMPRGKRQPNECSLETLVKLNKIDLFTIGNRHAWWPLLILDERGNMLPAGFIELEMHLVPIIKSCLKPVKSERESPLSFLGSSCSESRSLCKMILRTKEVCNRNYGTVLSIFFIVVVTSIISFLYWFFDLKAMVSYYWLQLSA